MVRNLLGCKDSPWSVESAPEFKSVVVIKRFMSYLKSAGVSKVNRPLQAHFSAGAVDLTGVCFRKPDVCVWNLLFASNFFFFSSHLHNIWKLLLFPPRPHHRHYVYASHLNMKLSFSCVLHWIFFPIKLWMNGWFLHKSLCQHFFLSCKFLLLFDHFHQETSCLSMSS